MPENTYARDARSVYANTFGVAMTPTDLALSFGIQLNPGAEDASMEIQTTVMLSLPGAKFLSILLLKLLADYEEAIGKNIPVDADRLSKFEQQMAAIKSKRKEVKSQAKPARRKRAAH